MNPKIIALHKHWCIADSVKQFIATTLPEKQNKDYPEWLIEFGNRASSFSRLSVWYALLYVVIEGYRDLKLSHNEIDKLLENVECVDCLRLFRNSIFHYQKDPINEKQLKFLEAKDSEYWIKKINKAFEKYFLEALPIKEQIEQIKQIKQMPNNAIKRME